MDNGDGVDEQIRREQERREQESVEEENSKHQKRGQVLEEDEEVMPLRSAKIGAGVLPKKRALSTDSANEPEGDNEFADNMAAPLDPTEEPEQVIKDIRGIFTAKDLRDLQIKVIPYAHGIRIYDANLPADAAPMVKTAVDPNTRLLSISFSSTAAIRPELLDKLEAITRDRKFIVKSCDSIESAKALYDKYKGNLIFDDNHFSMNSFKDRLEVEIPGIRLVSKEDKLKPPPRIGM